MSSSNSKEFNHSALKVACVLVSIAMSLVGFIFFKSKPIVVLAFITFLFFFVFLPGDLILSNMLSSCSHTSTRIVRAFFTGFIMNIVLYYLSAIIGTYYTLFFAGPLLSALWIYRNIYKKRHVRSASIKSIFDRVPLSCLVFFTFAFLYSMLTTQYNYIDPIHSHFSLMKQDFGFHAGIVNALAEGFPAKNPWIDGLTITYHYYTEMLLSIPVRVLHLTSDQILMTCTPYFIAPLFSISLYSFFREMGASGIKSGHYCLVFHLSNMFILKGFPNSWFLYHIYSNINNVGTGLACLLTTLPLLKAWDKPPKSGTYPSEIILFAFMTMLMTGIKGPISIILVCGMIGSLLLTFIMKKAHKDQLAVTGLAFISFCLIYVYVLGGEHSNASGGAVLNIGEVTDLFFLKSTIVNAFGSAKIPHLIALILTFIIFTFFSLTAFFVPVIFGYIRELYLVTSNKKNFVFSRVCIYSCFTVGFISMMIFNFSGHSQVYFGFTALSVAPVIAMWFFDDIKDNHLHYSQAIRMCFITCLILFSFSSALYVWNNVNSIVNYYNSRGEHLEKYRNLSKQEYEGLIWIRDNTEKDSLCASDRFNSVSMKKYDYTKRNNNTHFAYAIYSQRRQYLEGSGFSLTPSQNSLRKQMLDKNSALYNPSNERRGDDARSLGINYVIVSKRFNDPGDLSNNDYILCFSNEDIDIYRISS